MENNYPGGKVRYIENGLGVKLPENYRLALQNYPFPKFAKSTGWSLWDQPFRIVEATGFYRNMKYARWPENLLCIGDDGDCCPYALDLNDGSVSKVYKGNLMKLMERYESFDDFMEEVEADYRELPP